jgi:hypothetical protein
MTSAHRPIAAATSQPGAPVTATPTGRRPTTAIDAIDALAVNRETAIQTIVNVTATIGCSTAMTPPPVATPLPPRNQRKIGNT